MTEAKATLGKARLGKLIWAEDKQPRSEAFDDVYFSVENGLAESRYVFLESNKLKDRWLKLAPGSTFTIAETGFGTGLNFLAAWDLWQSLASDMAPNCRLHFISVEKFPLSLADISRAAEAWPELAAYARQLTEHYPPQPWDCVQTIPFASDTSSSVELTLILDDVRTAFKRLIPRFKAESQLALQNASIGEQSSFVDAWFLDGFAPAKNPDMWSDELYSIMAAASSPTTSFATFTAAGAVRRGLTANGFNCIKQAGFGRKREMLTGTFTGVAAQPSSEQNAPSSTTDFAKPKARKLSRKHTRSPSWPYQASTNTPLKDKTVIVIGAGLAGCHAANALARCGFKVTLVEAQDLASGASSNVQGAVYTRLSASEDTLSYFNRSAQLYADAFYQNNDLYKAAGEQCGVLHLCHSDKAAERLANLSSRYPDYPSLRLLNAEQASELAGVELKCGGLHAHRAGWLSPPRVCELLADHPNIELIKPFSVDALNMDDQGWSVKCGTSHIQASYCVVANAVMAKQFEQLSTLPLKSIRGQVSHIEPNDALSNLRTVLCGEGYLMPPTTHNGRQLQSIGATYNIGETSSEVSDRDNFTNLESLSHLKLNINDAPTLLGSMPAKVGFRATTPDYLPIVGPVPNFAEMNTRFALLAKKANADIDACGAYHPGLYCLLGLGSRGLAYAPLAANILSRLISSQFIPIERSLYTHVHPARFIIRSLIKNRPLSH